MTKAATSVVVALLLGAIATSAQVVAPAGSSTTPGGPSGGIVLTNASAVATLTGDAAWTLSKTGTLEVEPGGGTVTWTITATEAPDDPNRLLVTGHLSVTNTGTGPATIGNIVVNL